MNERRRGDTDHPLPIVPDSTLTGEKGVAAATSMLLDMGILLRELPKVTSEWMRCWS